MTGVFQNIDPPSPSPPGACVPPPPPPLVRGEDTLARRREGWGVNILEDVRHSFVLYVCKYFGGPGISVYGILSSVGFFQASLPRSLGANLSTRRMIDLSVSA